MQSIYTTIDYFLRAIDKHSYFLQQTSGTAAERIRFQYFNMRLLDVIIKCIFLNQQLYDLGSGTILATFP